jgi:hypothetical protein
MPKSTSGAQRPRSDPGRQAITLFTEELDVLSDIDTTWIMGRGLAEWRGWLL